MYENYDERNKAFDKITSLRNEIKSIHKDLVSKGLCNCPPCPRCKGNAELYSYLAQDTVICSYCEGEGIDYLTSTTDKATY